MKVSYKWLSQYIDLNGISPYELADKLTNSGVAVDNVEKINHGVEKVVIGYVLNCEKHPDAEKLNLCTVDVGQGNSLQIICGAANVAKGQKVPVAIVGANLPGGVTIKKAKLRGIYSEGMICSAKELGLNEKLLPKEKTEGILVLPEDSRIGENIDSLLGLDDYILELDLTPNRSDCLSMLGVAYEVGAIFDKEVQIPKVKLNSILASDNQLNVKIEAKDACNHYAGRLLTGIQIKESPQWLQNRLMAAGIRPINNIVDITNYVLLEYGQPLHAFDFDKLEQPNILVRMAKPNERIVTLDDQERELDEEMLLITDGVKPIAIAGVMGGANSEVTEKTTKILLESAYFNGISIRKTSKKLGLRSEASLRFEKGVDPSRIHSALNRAVELIQELAGAKIEGDIYEDIINPTKEKRILINHERVNKLLGTNIKIEKMVSIIKRLDFTVFVEGNDLLVEIPTRRQDITIEADLVEEIARIHGYDNIPTTLPSGMYIQGGLNKKQNIRRKIKDLMNASGLKEVITYTFTGMKQQAILKEVVEEKIPIKLAMPLSEEKQYLRTALLPNLLEVAEYNLNRRNPDIRIFEIGAGFIAKESRLNNLPQEKLLLAGLLTGSLPHNWLNDELKLDFYYVKGILEELFKQLGLFTVEFKAGSINGYHPGRAAEIRYEGKLLGYVGQIYPDIQEKYSLKETYVFEIDLDQVFENTNTEIKYKQLPKFPAIQRDIALVVSEQIEANDIINTIYEEGKQLLEEIALFDVYEGEQIGKGLKSIAFSLTYRNLEKTLMDEDVAPIHERILSTLENKYKAELRK